MQGRMVGGNRALRHSFDATTLFAPSLSLQATFNILKFSTIASLRGHKQKKCINLFVHFLCFCPLELVIMLNFNIYLMCRKLPILLFITLLEPRFHSDKNS